MRVDRRNLFPDGPARFGVIINSMDYAPDEIATSSPPGRGLLAMTLSVRKQPQVETNSPQADGFDDVILCAFFAGRISNPSTCG